MQRLSANQADGVVTWVAGFALVALGIFLLSTPRSHLFLPGARIDLGNVSVGQTLEKAFTIVNDSSTPIVINGWAPSCHCVQANFPHSIVPAGKSVEAFVRTSATTPLGRRVARLSIQWHFGGESFVRTDTLVVSAKYVSPLSLSRERLDFGPVSLNETQTLDLHVRTGNTDQKWNGLWSKNDSNCIATHIEPDPSGFHIQAKLDSRGLTPGIWRTTIRLATLQNGTKTGDEIDVPVIANIEGPFSIKPPVLQFLEQRNRPLDFTLKVHSSTVPIRKLRFLGNSVQNPRFVITRDGMDAIVTGTVPKPVGNDTFVGKLPLQINDSPEGAAKISFIAHSG